jgi:transcriptional regulator with XRE-family HTH domain
MSEQFSERLAEALKRSGKSQTEISALAGITPPYLSDLKKGKKSNPSNEIVSALAKALGVSVGWLLANESKGTTSPSYSLREDPPIYGAKTTAREWETMFKKILDDSDLDWLLDRLDQLVNEAAIGDVNAARAVRMIIPRIRTRVAAIKKG